MIKQRVVIRETSEMFGGMVEETLTKGIIELFKYVNISTAAAPLG